MNRKMGQIYFLLTNSCNLKCTHCIRGDKENDYLNKEDAICCIDKLSDFYNESMLVLTGGEPTLHPQFEDILIYALNRFKFAVSVNTNGTTDFFTESNIENINKYKNLVIQVSLDGDKEHHDIIRGKGSFDKTLNLLKKLADAGIKVSVCTVVNKENQLTLRKLHKQLSDINIINWIISKEMPFGRAKKSESDFTTFEWNKLVDSVLEFSRVKTRILKSYDFSLLDRISDEELELIEKKAVCNCGTVKEKIYIYPDLTVYGCTCLLEFPLGNLKNEAITNILKSDNANMLYNYKLLSNSPCLECRYRKICNGGCIGMSYQMFGKLGVGDCNCPIVAKYAGINKEH